MEILALVPARGGSQGLPRKNILDLGGKPLIAHSILAARECQYVTRCVVTTDDDEIAMHAKQWGAEVLRRPAELATSTASSEAVIEHALAELERTSAPPDLLVLLQPTSPLRTATHLTEAIEHFTSQPGAGSLVSVCDFEHPPQRAFVLDHGRLRPLFDWTTIAQPRQAYPYTVRPNGAIYLTPVTRFRECRSLYSTPVLAYQMPREASIDVDTGTDLEEARSYFAK